MNSIRKALKHEDGSVAASLVFVMFSAVVMLSVLGLVLSTANASAATKQSSTLNIALASTQADTLGGIIGTGSPNAESDAGLLARIIESADGETTQEEVFREVDGNYLAGYDSQGKAIWVQQQNTKQHKFRDVRSNGDFTCAIDDDETDKTFNEVWCWGSNVTGQLGNGTRNASSSPTLVAGAQKFDTLANGTSFTMCGLSLTEKQPYCWGSNSHGQAGQVNAGDNVLIPTIVEKNSYAKLVQGATTTCGITATATVRCWGENNGFGKRYADEGAAAHGAPDEVKFPAGAGPGTADLVLDRSTACALSTAGKISCWSENRLGQVGKSVTDAVGASYSIGGSTAVITTASLPTAVIIPAGQDQFEEGTQTPELLPGSWKSLFISNEERTEMKSVVCAIASDDAASCWGNNDDGQLGNGKADDSDDPVQVVGGLKFSTMAVAAESVCAITTEGSPYCWGNNDDGQLGNGSTNGSAVPVKVGTSLAFGQVKAATGNKHWFCASTTDKEADLHCWGRNLFGQVGGSADPQAAPTKNAFPGHGVGEFSLGDYFLTTLGKKTGYASSRGHNNLGQAGIGSRSEKHVDSSSYIAQKKYTPAGYVGYVNGGRP